MLQRAQLQLRGSWISELPIISIRCIAKSGSKHNGPADVTVQALLKDYNLTVSLETPAGYPGIRYTKVVAAGQVRNAIQKVVLPFLQRN
jgi:hypothetical protein